MAIPVVDDHWINQSEFLPNSIPYIVLTSTVSLFLSSAGKTVQIVSLLAALFHKTGTGLDLLQIQHRRKVAAARSVEITSEKDAALLAGRVWKESTAGNAVEAGLSQWAPVLIVVPPSIIQNWVHDFSIWGHFSIAVYQGSQSGREKALESIRLGVAEVMICAKSLFTQPSAFSDLYQIKWKLIIVDEFHQFKNKKGVMAEHLRCIRDEHSALVVGLTGTLMQNSHDELWNLIDLVAKNYLGTWEEFEQDISIPIKLAR
jgi:SNF2 family DNA or RNA helicase